MKTMLLIVSLLGLCMGDYFESKRTGPLLRSFDGFKYDVVQGADGVYRFHFHTGDASRTEERDESGFVKGEYAFVAPEGKEYEFKYEADKEGYRVESDALPVQPEDTDAVKKAREEFLTEYEKALERAAESSYEYDDSSSEESDESSEESSEEDDDNYALFAYGFGNSLEESSEESSEEDDDDSDEEEEENKVARIEEAISPNSASFSHFGLRSSPYPYRRNRV